MSVDVAHAARTGLERGLGKYATPVDAEPDYRTPGALAKALDPNTRQTPALDVIDAALVDVADGACNRLVISMPPQEGKSERTTHYAVLWMLQRNPNLRIGIVSYGEDIAGQFSYKIRNDIATFNGDEDSIDLGLRLRKDNKAASRWNLAHPHKGGVYAIGVGGGLTGRPLDVLLIDDPVKDYKAADSLLLSETAWQWWMSVARPRLAPGAPVIVIQTRWHENDLAGRLLRKQAEDEASELEHFDQWRVINIPAQADHDPNKGETDPLGREPGEFLQSARGRTTAQWQATKAATSTRIWNALYQGRPSPGEGALLKEHWWRYYTRPPARFDETLTSWDMTFKDTKGSDFVVGQVWGRVGADCYPLDQVRGRWEFTETCTQVERIVRLWPDVRAHLVEDKANGPAVISQLRKRISGLIAVNPGQDSKFARAQAVAPFAEAGNVHLPDVEANPHTAHWVSGLVDECATFPNAAHDDQVDALSQALNRLLIVNQSVDAWRKLYEKTYSKPPQPTDTVPLATTDSPPRARA